MQQIKIRADRIGSFTESLELFCETNLADISSVLRRKKPRVVIIDSIQTMYSEEVSSAPGSVSPGASGDISAASAGKISRYYDFYRRTCDKKKVWWPARVCWKHMVDTVLYFEGDRHAAYRILRQCEKTVLALRMKSVYLRCSRWDWWKWKILLNTC